MDELLSKIITIKEVGLEDKRLKVTDMEGKVYSIWRTKQDGSETKAYSAFKDKALSAQGQMWEIAYDEKPNPQNAGTFYRAIKVIKEPSNVDRAMATPVQVGNTPSIPANDDLEFRIARLEEKVFGTEIPF